MSRDPRVDTYIAKSGDFARPILSYFREVVHTAVPDVEETMKWSAPHFDHQGIMIGMAAFKQHCGINFWKGPLIGIDGFGRVMSIEDLPPKKELIEIVRKLARLNEQGAKVARPKKAPKPEAKTPADFAAALKKNKKAASAYEGFSPSHRREYIQWITEAKTDETRKKRLDQAVVWIAEGKSRNWKYMKK